MKLPKLLLRIGLAFSFFYAALASFSEPQNWIGFFPMWLKNLMPASILITGFSIYEIALGLWLIFGRYLFLGAIVSVLTLVGIVLFNIASFDTVFRDVTIIFAALALAFLSKKSHSNE